MASATTYRGFAKKLEQAGATIWGREPHADCPGGHFYASRGGKHVRVFFNADDRFICATKVDGRGMPVRGPKNLERMATVERYLGIS